MVNAQEWLEQNYPKEERKNIKRLEINDKNLKGHLNLSDFINLEKLDCSKNKLTSIDLSDNKKLEVINCSNNLLTDVDFSYQDPEKLCEIDIKNNNLSLRDLFCFNSFVNLKKLLLGTDDEEKLAQNIYNRFHYSLGYLINLKKLEELDISGTDVDEGLELLFLDNLKSFYCAKKRDGAKVEEIRNTLRISEEQAESRSEEDNKEKISIINGYQLHFERYFNETIETMIIQNLGYSIL